jgi:hypothetical protein
MMWEEYNGGGCKFGMDDPKAKREERLREFERKVAEYNVWTGVGEGVQDILDIDETGYSKEQGEEDDVLSQILESIGAPGFT